MPTLATMTDFAFDVFFARNGLSTTPQLLDTSVALTAPTSSFVGGGLTVSGLLAEDRISVLHEGDAAGQIGFAGGTVSYGGTAIGTASGGSGATFTVVFSAAVTAAAVEALIEHLTYANVSSTPTAKRSLTIDVTDSAGDHVLALPPRPVFTPLTGSDNPVGSIPPYEGSASRLSAPNLVDLDGDGDLDLVLGRYDGTLRAWQNTGSSAAPSFTALTGAANPFGGIDVGFVSAPTFVDLDGDGLLDLVSGNRVGTLLAWRNVGTSAAPSFTALTDSANPFNGIDVSFASGPAFTDLDGDGLLDLVLGHQDGTLLAWRNTGTSAAPVFTALTGTANPFDGIDVGTLSAPAFVDLDGDGLLDLVSGEYDGALLAWRNTGTSATPNFTALTGSANPFTGVGSEIGWQIEIGSARRLAFGDLNGDGRPDLITGDYDGSLRAFRNTAPPPGAPVTVTVNTPPNVNSSDSASVAENFTGTVYWASAWDVNRNPVTWTLGGQDAALFSINGATGEVSFLATPDYEAPQDAGADNIYNISVIAADGFDSGSADVAITITNVLERPTLGSVSSGVTFAENTVNATPQLLDASVTLSAPDSSLGGGGLTVSGLLAEDRISVLHQGDAAGQIGFASGIISFGGTAIGTATGGSGSTFTVVFNQAATAPAVQALIQHLTYANVSDTPTATRSLKIDVTDSAGVHFGPPGIEPFTALPGSSNPFNGIDVGSYSSPAFVDLDGDGDLDLVSGNYDGYLLAWENIGTSAAPSFTELQGTDNPFDGFYVDGYRSMPVFVDLDGDGDLDLVSGNVYGNLLAWENVGTSQAPSFTALTGTSNPFDGMDVGDRSTPAFVDLDGDGDLDLVSGEYYGTLLAWENTGISVAPSFTALTGTDNPFDGIAIGYATAPAFVDLDGDGDLDLVSGVSGGTFLAWRNTGSGYTALTGNANPFNGTGVGSYSSYSKPSFVDLDGDGRLDLVSGVADGSLHTWRNTPADTFITVSVTAEAEGQNNAPAITSGTTASFAENAIGTVYQATATDAESNPLTWSLGGADANRFDISTTGAVTFKAAPNFEAPTDAGGDNVYNITVTANDGTQDSPAQAVAITVTNVVEQPALTGVGTTASFAENTVNAAAQLLDADVVFTAGESLVGGRLVVAGLLAEDRVSVLTQGSGAGQIGFDGTTVSYGGVAFGTATGGLGADFTITFNASVTSPAVDALIQRLSYANISDTPTATRALTLNVVDGTGAGLVGISSLTALTGAANPFNGFDVGAYSTPSFVDLDGDGRLDLVAGAENGTFLAWRNTGSGFTALTGSASPFNGLNTGGASTPSFVDLDGDGLLDLVSGTDTGTSFLALRNTGSGFSSLVGSANPFSSFNVGYNTTPSFVDLDGDGRLDLVSGE
ncbi:Repeat domain-containing protein, partial [Falsiroseomonas stagni DSM 19981]